MKMSLNQEYSQVEEAKISSLYPTLSLIQFIALANLRLLVLWPILMAVIRRVASHDRNRGSKMFGSTRSEFVMVLQVVPPRRTAARFFLSPPSVSQRKPLFTMPRKAAAAAPTSTEGADAADAAAPRRSSRIKEQPGKPEPVKRAPAKPRAKKAPAAEKEKEVAAEEPAAAPMEEDAPKEPAVAQEKPKSSAAKKRKADEAAAAEAEAEANGEKVDEPATKKVSP
jgi:hypothetical protein